MEGFKREIITTADGSHTLSIPELGITFHSTHGAVAESEHIFLMAGLAEAFRRFPEGKIDVFEMGFGTGLNAFLTAIEANKRSRDINYTAIEQYPLSPQEAAQLNYGASEDALFSKIHSAEWEHFSPISPFFKLLKMKGDLAKAILAGPFHAIYFDAFAPDAQPHLWTEAVFSKLYNSMAEGGVLTTYCSKSIVRRAMTAAGFTVKKIPGPFGKREMVQAFKFLI